MIILIKVDIRMFLEWENNRGKLQIISGKFQNNAINDVKQISLSHVITYKKCLIWPVIERVRYREDSSKG